jgi:hypothetical protein
MRLVDRFAHRFFNPDCPLLISRVDVNATPQPTWNWADGPFRQKQAEDYAFYRQFCRDLAERGKLTDEVYSMDNWAFRKHFGITTLKLTPPRDAYENNH